MKTITWTSFKNQLTSKGYCSSFGAKCYKGTKYAYGEPFSTIAEDHECWVREYKGRSVD